MIRFNGFDTSGLLRSVATLALAAAMTTVVLADADAHWPVMSVRAARGSLARLAAKP